MPSIAASGAPDALRGETATLVRAITPYDPVEQQQLAAASTWIDSGAPLCRIQPPANPPQHLVSYFVLLDIAERQILLVDHRKAGLWLPSGGHVEPGEHPHATVVRELREELGIDARFVFPQPIFLTVTQTVGALAVHTDVSLWYVLHGDCGDPLHYDRDEFHAIAWFPLDQLPLDRTDPHLARFVSKLTLLMNA